MATTPKKPAAKAAPKAAAPKAAAAKAAPAKKAPAAKPAAAGKSYIDPVWVRAMVLNANGTTIATAIVDATGISNRMLKVVPLPAPPWRRVPALAAKRTSPRTARTRPAALPRKSARA